MRWFLFATCFLIFVFLSFWIYVWNFRAEFVQSGMERACPHYRVALGSVDIFDYRTWIIRHVSFTDTVHPETPAILIPECTLSSSLFSWLRWLIIPSKAPLYIESATMTFSKASPFFLANPQLFTGIRIGTLTAVWPNGSSSVFTNMQGSLSEILLRILRDSEHTQQPTSTEVPTENFSR